MRVINTFGSKEHPLQNIICSWKDAKYLSERFAAFKYTLEDKYCDRPDLSVNGFSLTAGEIIDFMNGKKKDKWFKHCKEDGKEKEVK